jgi:hypothetical protein
MVSFDIIWSGVDERIKIRNDSTDFGGEFIRNSASLIWSASESGFSFTSNPDDSHFAEIGPRAQRRILPLARGPYGRQLANQVNFVLFVRRAILLEDFVKPYRRLAIDIRLLP